MFFGLILGQFVCIFQLIAIRVIVRFLVFQLKDNMEQTNSVVMVEVNFYLP